MSFSLQNKARHPTPRMSFLKTTTLVLGKDYSLSLVFIPPRMMRDLNKAYRNKNTATDILSFPLSKTTGEMFICMDEVKKRSGSFEMNKDEYLGYLFIHGLVHLKGHDHGKKMDALEKKICEKLKIKHPH